MKSIKAKAAQLPSDLRRIYKDSTFSVNHSPRGGFDVYAYRDYNGCKAYNNGSPIAHIDDIYHEDALLMIISQAHKVAELYVDFSIQKTQRKDAKPVYTMATSRCRRWTRCRNALAELFINDAAFTEEYVHVTSMRRIFELSFCEYADVYHISVKGDF